MVEQQGFGRRHGNRNPEWKIQTERSFNRKWLGKAKQKFTITGSKGKADLGKITPQNRSQTETITKEVEEELGKRKIGVSEEENQLRWGRKNGCEFNLKEACYYIVGQDQENMEQPWEKMWKSPQWPKIKMFKWLVLHNRILTWENLMKKGFHRSLSLSSLSSQGGNNWSPPRRM